MAATPPLAGVWSGDRTILTITASGGSIEQDCASGSFTGPLTVDKRGQFQAQGVFAAESGGPQKEAAIQHPAAFIGQLDGQNIRLTVRSGAGAPISVTLQPGRKVKLIRCL